jgi:repressor LexA
VSRAEGPLVAGTSPCGISYRQSLILQFIEAYLTRNGYPPTHEEIRAGLGLSSKSTVHYHLEMLEYAGRISRTRNTPRGIRLK